MNKITGLLRKPISYNIILVLLIIAFALLIIPLLYIAKWDVPSADDYSNAIAVHDVILAGGSFGDIMRTAFNQTKQIYNEWQGSASAVFLFALQPMAFGDQYYMIVPYLMLISLTTGVCVFMISFFELFSAKKQYGAIIAITLLIGCTQFLPSPVQGFYWYTGSVYYTFFFGISLILYTLLLKIVKKKDTDKVIGKQITIYLLCAFIALGNYITALTTAILLCSLTAFLILNKNKTWKLTIPALIIYGSCFYLNLAAPGNKAHIDAYVSDIGLWKSLTQSFEYAITQITTWNSVPITALYIFLLPLLWKTASETNYSFKYPWLVSLYSFCLFASMNFPTFYAGAEHAGRVQNIRYYAMLILFVLNIFYWCGWLGKNCFRYTGKNQLQMNVKFLAGVIVMFLIGLINIPSYRITSYSAVQSYFLGQIGSYKHVFNQRMEILNDPEISDAVLREYPQKKPFLLFFDDIYTDPNNWRNLAVSEYFHKNSVRLQTENEPVTAPSVPDTNRD